jgi:hypothetical protein
MLAVACLVVAYINRDNPGKGQIEGAYFEPKTPGEGWTAYAPIEEEPVGFSRFEPFDAWDPYLWLGAGTALALVAGFVALRTLRHKRPA